ncbi:MAG: alpha/beta hydrolase fold protein [uncultured bacterium]|uniref:Alpha/beta hydrolase fold protein n=1 Tax=Candidatus Woesebacteria bacterium GW2011_GWA1_40_43 TaxID=1618553 RepID=A0A0G0VGD9_9BACT|nr:MAG: alpha/beta hydrolase fold protein [uncultured bacterium]KKR53057.1 MAG: Alpha/beta hydrolase fold protein [Candidatus Woesebacteria bacterium GW2011_GWD2_40_19]KKR57906.1 MAG: Alpha/beta hydrolase fold protein [Candidatus Woesebacteria bacterium GW2011_GWC2_40_30]KKR61792.1 MAG: Alpha/beta hydrolase fold protein [Candidatus Woesebacteria bacterium GW2011_GWA1_40_43]HAU65209.1 hypothetical protein [Candidatus Woesebacteria bacterium]
MDQKLSDENYKTIEAFALSKMSDLKSVSHNDYHVIRVRDNAFKIAKLLGVEERIDKNLLATICMLHDFTYSVRKPNIYTYIFEGRIERRMIRSLLKRFDIPDETKEIIIDAVFRHAHSFPFKKLNKKHGLYTKILQDADTLDFFDVSRVNYFLTNQNKSFFKSLRKAMANALLRYGKNNLGLFLNYPVLAKTFFENPSMKQKDRFHYYEYGINNSETLLFLPGYADSGLMYQKLGRSLSKDYRVLALDFPMIHDPEKIYDLTSLTNFVDDFVKELRLTNFTIVGFSSCGLVAISYTYNRSDKVKELILLNSVPRFILSKVNRKIYQFVKPFILLRPILFIYSRINTNKTFRKIMKLPHTSTFTRERMRTYYYSATGTAVNLIGESVFARFKKIKVPKKIIFFKDDTIIPWERYQRFVEKLDCEVVVFSEGLHADKRIYWEKLKTLWLKTPKIEFQDVSIEKSK